MDFNLGDEVGQTFTDVNSSIKIIHGGMTPLLQFVDTHIKKSFKDIRKEKWKDWIVNGEAGFVEKGNRKHASYQLVGEWADNTWKKVATDELVIKGIRHVIMLNTMVKLQICIQDYKKQSRNAKFQRR